MSYPNHQGSLGWDPATAWDDHNWLLPCVFELKLSLLGPMVDQWQLTAHNSAICDDVAKVDWSLNAQLWLLWNPALSSHNCFIFVLRL